nr:MAG TPA: hypothetical protein [Caudoviricetes sp.]
MKITLDIPDGMVCCFLNGVIATLGGMNMVSYPLGSDDLHDGAEIKLPREEQKQ